ncbi:hypothetical protein FWK35_00023976, partial [Aphis craccivora]
MRRPFMTNDILSPIYDGLLWCNRSIIESFRSDFCIYRVTRKHKNDLLDIIIIIIVKTNEFSEGKFSLQ